MTGSADTPNVKTATRADNPPTAGRARNQTQPPWSGTLAAMAMQKFTAGAELSIDGDLVARGDEVSLDPKKAKAWLEHFVTSGYLIPLEGTTDEPPVDAGKENES